MTDPLLENVSEKNEAHQITEQYSEVIAKSQENLQDVSKFSSKK